MFFLLRAVVVHRADRCARGGRGCQGRVHQRLLWRSDTCARWLPQVPSSADAAEIRVAWRRKSMLTHPDKLKDAPGGLQASQRVNEARSRAPTPQPSCSAATTLRRGWLGACP